MSAFSGVDKCKMLAEYISTEQFIFCLLFVLNGYFNGKWVFIVCHSFLLL